MAWLLLVGSALGQGAEGAPAPAAIGGSIPEMVAQGRRFEARVRRATVSVRAQLRQARGKRDVVKVLCLNDKLSQADVADRTSTDHVQAMDAAASDNDATAVRHEVTVLGVLSDRADSIGVEAGQCIGEEAGFVGDSDVSVQVDPTLPEVGVGGTLSNTTNAGTGADFTSVSYTNSGSSIAPPPVVSSPVD